MVGEKEMESKKNYSDIAREENYNFKINKTVERNVEENPRRFSQSMKKNFKDFLFSPLFAFLELSQQIEFQYEFFIFIKWIKLFFALLDVARIEIHFRSTLCSGPRADRARILFNQQFRLNLIKKKESWLLKK